MADPLRLAPEPCSSCPYRADHPSGVWHPDEYNKLPAWDDMADGCASTETTVFLCHGDPDRRATACRGWVSVHRHSIAVRLAVATGTLDGTQVFTVEPDAELHPDGAAAAAAGLARAGNPGPAARAMQARLARTDRQRREARNRALTEDTPDA